MTRYQVPREETSINLTNISEQVYLLILRMLGLSVVEFSQQALTELTG